MISSPLGLENVTFAILITFSPYMWLIVAVTWSKNRLTHDGSKFSEESGIDRAPLARTGALVLTIIGMVMFLPLKTWIVIPGLIIFHFVYVGRLGNRIDDTEC